LPTEIYKRDIHSLPPNRIIPPFPNRLLKLDEGAVGYPMQGQLPYEFAVARIYPNDENYLDFLLKSISNKS
jgi:hypothetical protein